MSLKVNNVEKSYGTNKVLNSVSFEIEDGKICALLGPSGSGKSTLLNLIGGIEKIDAGTIILNEKDITNLNEKDLCMYRRGEIGFIFQFYNLIPNLTVKENIESAADLSKSPLDINELLKTLDLEEHKNKFPNQLSGGQQQRCAIGRAIIKNPNLLLCDEPTGALDSKSARDILKLIVDINKKYNTTVIIVTHNDAIVSIANQIVKLHDGKIASDEINEKVALVEDIKL